MLMPTRPGSRSDEAVIEGRRSTASKPAPAPLARLFEHAGVEVNGSAAWDLQLHDRAAWGRMLRHGTLGFGESYMDGQWDCERLDTLVCRLLRANADRVVTPLSLPGWLSQVMRHGLMNLQTVSRAFHVARQHYDIGNDLFAAMLDSQMVYSCAYWARASDLEGAQRDKLDLIGRKLELRPRERLLDVGCGWGGLAAHAARHFGCQVTGATVSHEQAALARERCADLPVEIALADWRSLAGRYDKVVSVGMFEHVGQKNYRAYFRRMRELVEPEGLFLLHTIGSSRTERATNAWTERYIFPNGKLPSAIEIARAAEGLFIIEDWHNFGHDYDRTLMAWWERFARAWPSLQGRYDERFFRMWKFYLLSSAGFFRSRQGQLWQIVLTPRERSTGYRSVR
jgi:cyclopropane-fatty-acyl-phospholipid synthase